MSEVKHTLTPWTIAGTLIFGGHEPGIGSYSVAQTFMTGDDGLPITGELEQAANREYIVRCVNVHNDLLEACKVALERLDLQNRLEADEEIAVLRAAIATGTE